MTDELRAEYISLFDKCEVRDDPHALIVVRDFVAKLFEGTARYEEVSSKTGVPFYVIGIIHGLEGGFDFKTHLHNGDPLTDRTRHVPRGRPPTGDPPFTWVDSAVDALRFDHLSTWNDWSVPGIAYKLESFNGWGYRKEHINSPYLWSMSNQYERGKFTSDGHYDPAAVSDQCGGITALKQMVNDHLVALPAQPVSTA